jgi:putative nucleotidyltransferase with HDIG domain
MTIDKDKKSAMFKSELAIAFEENSRLAAELVIANTELAIAIVEKSELAAELINANKELAIESAEKAMRAAELVIANEELATESAEKAKRAAELVIANKWLDLEANEKVKLAAELVIANKELAIESAEKAKRATELVIANEKLAMESAEKAKRAAELVIANKELAIESAMKIKRAAELVIANKELAIESAMKINRAAELVIVNKELAIVNARLQTSLLETIELARQLVELRDPFTAGHEMHVGQLAKAIAAQMGFDENRQEGLMVAGYLHDIGKIIIPVEILSKPGKISIEEFSLIKNHVQSSYDLLKNVGFKWDIAEPIYEHHERLDGSGYPRKLRADQISIDARILAVADVVESIFNYRPYRPERGVDAALSAIKQGRGTLYDASVVDACIKVFEDGFEFEKIKDMRIGGTPFDNRYDDADSLLGKALGDHKSKKPVV